MSQGMQKLEEARTEFHPGHSRRHVDFNPGTPIWELQPLALRHSKCMLFPATEFLATCCSSQKKLIRCRVCSLGQAALPHSGNNVYSEHLWIL